MNKYELALNWIGEQPILNEFGEEISDIKHDGSTKKEFNLLNELVEKATPKKPYLQGDGYDPSGNIVLDTWICPNCEEHYEVGYDDYDYCPKCGQSLDLSEIREAQDED